MILHASLSFCNCNYWKTIVSFSLNVDILISYHMYLLVCQETEIYASNNKSKVF